MRNVTNKEEIAERASRCYLVQSNQTGAIVLQTESAREVAIWALGKDLREWTVYKAVRCLNAECSIIQHNLESR
jgi:hypothetical protein